MRNLVLAGSLCAIGILAASAPVRSQTYDPNYPVCLHVFAPMNYYSCHYVSLAQCNPSASGRSAECIVNPYYAGAIQRTPARRHQYRHKRR
jgi:hypothetical protein